MSDIMTNALSAKNLVKKFSFPSSITILKGIDLNVQQGQSVAIIGKSGEGKTTLLHILGTIDSPSSGELNILGTSCQNANSEKLRNEKLGFIFQAFHLLLDATVMENILLPAYVGRKSINEGSYANARAKELIAQVGLENRAHFPCLKLSGGEKQRVAIARAFINNPEIIFADEPTGNLDHTTAIEIQELLFQSVKREKKTLILVTHNEDLAFRCDEVFELIDGTLQKRERKLNG